MLMSENNRPEFNKILIVKPSSLGDIFHAFPAVTLLRRRFPNAEFHWLVFPAFTDALQFLPCVKRTILFPRRELAAAKTFVPAFFRLLKELRRERYDAVIDFQGLFRSAFFAGLCRSPLHAGFKAPKENCAGIFYNAKAEVPARYVHAAEKNVFLVSQLFGADFSVEFPELPRIAVFADALELLLKESHIAANAPIIGIVPGARWPSKQWPPRFFADIISRLATVCPELQFIILGTGEDRQAAEEIIAGTTAKAVYSLVGRTRVGVLVEAVRRCRLLISNDSGPIHIAAALNKPVAAFFGPTDPSLTGPYGDRHLIFQRRLDCIKCLRRECPLGSYACRELAIAEIVDRLTTFINQG